jgi:adenylate cyclase
MIDQPLPHHRLIAVPEPEDDLAMVLGNPRKFTSREVSDAVGIPMYRARRYWRALGFANVPDGAAEFTHSDIDALSTLVGLVRDGILSESQCLAMARVLGRTTARLSFSHTEDMVKILDAGGASGAERRTAAVRLAERIVPDIDRLLQYGWRRHLVVAVQRLQPHVGTEGPFTATIGFADLVSFTRLSRQMSDRALESLVGRFESRASDLVTSHGGRVIKSLGDEVLFVADDPKTGAAIALDIAALIQRTHQPGVRIGVESGPVIAYAGDVFGDTVNLASRLTSMAEPNGILVGPALADALAGDGDFELRPITPVKVRGYGVVVPATLSRTGTPRHS